MGRVSRRWQQVASAAEGDDYAEAYAERFRSLLAEGQDIHGEADFVAGLCPPPARVLDAGCGTGRVAVRLAELGYDVVGCDADASMIEVAQRELPSLDWRVADLAHLADGELGAAYDVVVLAGNVIPFLEPGTLGSACRGVAGLLTDGGTALVGFGLDDDHLPDGVDVVSLAAVDAAMENAGLPRARGWSGWDGSPFDPAAGYAVVEYAPGDGQDVA